MVIRPIPRVTDKRPTPRRKHRPRVIIGISLALALAPATLRAQEVGKDVPPTHWAYEAVQDLASKGLIKGYPPDDKFLGGRTLTRYEMATIIQRVLARVDDLLKGGSQTDLDKLNTSVGEIRELVGTFKMELTVIGTDMQQVKADLDSLKGQVGQLSGRVDTLEGQAGALTKRVDETNIAVDQALENITELKNSTNAALARKVDVGTGRLRVGGLLQVWYGTAFGDTLGGNAPGQPVPPGRNFGGGVGDTFRLRRGQITLDGNVTRQADYHVMFDVAKTGTGSSSVLQDLVVGYQLAPRWRIELGQQKTGLSEEGTRSNSELLTIVRSIMNEDLPAVDGRVGNIRDTGLVLRYQGKRFNSFVGIWNDNGATQNLVDNNRQKFLDGAIYGTFWRYYTVGIWGGMNVGDSKPAEKRSRAGGTAIARVGPHFAELEVAYAQDYAAGAPAPGKTGALSYGAYLLYAHTISRKWQLVARYDIWDPGHHNDEQPAGPVTTEDGTTFYSVNHKLHEYTFGVNYYIHGNNAKIQLNYIRVDTEDNGGPFFGKQRTVLLMNYQLGF